MNLLDGEDRGAFFRGCLELREEQPGILPVRFTDAQRAVYAEPEGRRTRSLCTAGVSLDIRTDTDRIDIAFASPRGARAWIYFDVWVDDVLVGHAGHAKATDGPDAIECGIPCSNDGLRRVTMYLPHCRELYLVRVAVAPGATVEPAPRHERNLLCTGDSITQGMTSLYPSNTYTVQLARQLGLNLLNQGVGGDVFNAESLDPGLPWHPDIVTVAYGTNDWGHCPTANAFRAACKAYVDRLAAQFPDARVFVLTPLWRADLEETRPMGPFARLGEILAEVCADHERVTVLDGLTLTPHTPAYYADERLHPNDLGFMHYAANLRNALER